MKNEILTGFFISGLLAICFSCGMHRRTADTVHYRDKELHTMDRIESVSDIGLSTSASVLEVWKDFHIHRREYDLERPAGKDGLHPVKSDVWIDGEEKQKKEKEENTEKESEKQTWETIGNIKERSAEVSQSSEIEVDAGVFPLWWWLLGVVSVLIGSFILWWRYGKKDKTK